MLGYLSSIWRCRFFWLSLVKMDLRTRYRRSFLGLGWSLLHPISMTIVLCVVFKGVLSPGEDMYEYAPFLMAGIATWSFIVTAAVQGCHAMFQGESYIRQFPAPMAIYPLRTALGSMIHFLIALTVVIGMAFLFRLFTGSQTRLVQHPAALLSLVPTVVLLFLFAWSAAILTGFANVFFQDTQHLCDVAFQMLFYMTPVCYYPSILRNRHLDFLVDYNPAAAFLELVRQPILHGAVPSVFTYLTAAGTVVLLMGCAALTLARKQQTLIFHM